MKSKDLEMGPFKIDEGVMKMCEWFPLQLFVTRGSSEDARAELCSDRENVGSSLFHPSTEDNRNDPSLLLMHITSGVVRRDCYFITTSSRRNTS